MYDIGKFYQAADVEDAVRALVEDPEAVVISGGSDVLIKIREGKLAGCSLVSIHGIKELEGIRMEEDGTIVIGPATTFSHITNNDIIQKHIPMLGDAVDMAGGPQLRNIGTIGGNVCNGVTSADSASSLCCLAADLVLKGPDGVREVPITQWYTGPGRTVRNHDEVLTALRIKKENYQGYGGQYIKYGKRNAMEIATLGCAVSVKLTEDKKHIQDLRLAGCKGNGNRGGPGPGCGKRRSGGSKSAFQLEGFQGVQAAAGGGAGQACRKAGRNQRRR